MPEDLRPRPRPCAAWSTRWKSAAAWKADESVRLPIAQPYRFDDCGWVANRWCELLPMQPELKQRLMELDSPLMRLELVSDLLARTGIAK